jgi:hypothetical protein
MAGRKRRLSSDEDDEMDTDEREAPARARTSDHGNVSLTVNGAVTRHSHPEMRVVWRDRDTEQEFKDSVEFATDFGAQLAVGLSNGTVLWFRRVDDVEPVVITGRPAMDIVGRPVFPHTPSLVVSFR